MCPCYADHLGSTVLYERHSAGIRGRLSTREKRRLSAYRRAEKTLCELRALCLKRLLHQSACELKTLAIVGPRRPPCS